MRWLNKEDWLIVWRGHGAFAKIIWVMRGNVLRLRAVVVRIDDLFALVCHQDRSSQQYRSGVFHDNSEVQMLSTRTGAAKIALSD